MALGLAVGVGVEVGFVFARKLGRRRKLRRAPTTTKRLDQLNACGHRSIVELPQFVVVNRAVAP